MKQINDSDFESSVSSGNVLVCFSATWCGPCKQLTPTLEALSLEFTDITFLKADIDECEEMATKYGVRSVPTMILFKDGQVVSTKVGNLNKSKLTEWLSELIVYVTIGF